MTACNPNHTDIIKQIRSWVFAQLTGDVSGHDYWHCVRVCHLAMKIQQTEGGNPLIIQASALLHDLSDWKFQHESRNIPAEEIHAQLLNWLPVKPAQSIIEIIRNISFKGAGVDSPLLSLEGKIVQDADRLDALGAIGIARAFAYGGSRQRPMHDPDTPPVFHRTFEEYQTRQSTTINHFYEKLLLLKDRMNTETGRKLAEERHRFIEQFLVRFFDEWNGSM